MGYLEARSFGHVVSVSSAGENWGGVGGVGGASDTLNFNLQHVIMWRPNHGVISDVTSQV